jgi:hypothetical protein
MSSPASILDRCRRHGLQIWAEGDRIGIAPKENIPPGLLDEIRAAKPILLPLVREGVAHQLSADQVPWLHVARQILEGEFNGSSGSTCASLWIGLRSLSHPTARIALRKLAREPKCPKAICTAILRLPIDSAGNSHG